MTDHCVHVVLPASVDDPATPSGGNTYDRRVCAGLAGGGWSVHEVALPGAWPWPEPRDLRRLAAALGAVPDGTVVLVDGLVACPAGGVVTPHARRLHLVVLVHLPLADETGAPPKERAVLDTLEGSALRSARAVVATSEATAGQLVRRHGLGPARVHVAAPGVDAVPAARGTDGGGALLCAAAVTPRKGHDVLVDALARLADLPWTCVCAGPLDRAPAFADEVRHRVCDGALADRVRFPGALAPPDLAARYAASDLLILPSRAEPYGMVVTEALARGIPVVGAAVDGIPEALGRAPGGASPGVLVPPGDPVALAAALRRWLTDAQLRARMRGAARARRATLAGWEQTVGALAHALTAAASAA
ncbi:MAG: glycosyltransferase family 4 protein [Kineosporiaceae bacterium]